MKRYFITSDWQGNPISAHHTIMIEFPTVSAGDRFSITVEAPFFPNRPPPSPPGATDRLWEYDVVECFFLGDNECYLEVELGPFGHYLALKLEGRRIVTETLLPLAYAAEITGNRWTGRVDIPNAYLPTQLKRWNAYGIFKVDGERKHLALFPLGGDVPDFHRLEDFGAVEMPIP